MKYSFALIATAAGLASAQYSDYSYLAARGDISADYESQLELITRALADTDDINDGLFMRSGTPSGSRRSSVSLSRTNSMGSMIDVPMDSHGKVQSSGNGRSGGDNRNPSAFHQAQNGAQRGAAYAHRDPAGFASTSLSMAGGALGFAGGVAGLSGNPAAAAGCAAGAAGCNAAANAIDKSRAGKKAAKEASKKHRRDLLALYARSLLDEEDFGSYPEIAARSYDDVDIFADEHYYN